MAKTYLITGGAGFIGSNFVKYLLGKYGDTVELINIDSLTYAGNLENLTEVENLPNYRFEKADICDLNQIRKIFAENDIDIVIHMAAESHVDRSILNPDVFIQTNVVGTNNLLTAARERWDLGSDTYAHNKRFVHVSTDEVYGSLELGDSYFYEDTPISPRSPYSSSKASSDLFVLANWETFKLPVIVTRCSNNYGPYQFPEKLIPLMINNALEGKPLPVYGDGLNIRDWLYVEDHCKAIDLVAEKGRIGEVYNIGGHNEIENINIVKIIIKTLNDVLNKEDIRQELISENLIKFVTDRKGHDRRYAIAPDKIHKELGWLPETNFNEGIVKTIRWYLENTKWLKNITSGNYKSYYDNMYNNR